MRNPKRDIGVAAGNIALYLQFMPDVISAVKTVVNSIKS